MIKRKFFFLVFGFITFFLVSCSFPSENIDFHSHVYTITDVQEASCTEDGYKIHECELCHTSYKEIIKALGHDYVLKEEVASSYDEAGYKKYVCSRCNAEKIVNVDKVEHNYTNLCVNNVALDDGIKIEFSSSQGIINLNQDIYTDETFLNNFKNIDYNQVKEISFADNIGNVSLKLEKFKNINKLYFNNPYTLSYIGEYIIYNNKKVDDIYFNDFVNIPKVDDYAFFQIDGGYEMTIHSNLIWNDVYSLGGRAVVYNNDVSSYDESILTYNLKASVSARNLAQNMLKNDNKDLLLLPYSDIDTFKQIKTLAKEIIGNETDEYKCVRLIYNWVTTNIAYDVNSVNYSVKEVLNTKRGVCAGYSMLIHDLLASLNIYSFYVNGGINMLVDYDQIFNDSFIESHAWNIVVLDDRTVVLDATYGASNQDDYFDMSDEQVSRHVTTLKVNYYTVFTDLFSANHYKIAMIYGKNCYYTQYGRASGYSYIDNTVNGYKMHYNVKWWSNGFNDASNEIGAIVTNLSFTQDGVVYIARSDGMVFTKDFVDNFFQVKGD